VCGQRGFRVGGTRMWVIRGDGTNPSQQLLTKHTHVPRLPSIGCKGPDGNGCISHWPLRALGVDGRTIQGTPRICLCGSNMIRVRGLGEIPILANSLDIRQADPKQLYLESDIGRTWRASTGAQSSSSITKEGELKRGEFEGAKPRPQRSRGLACGKRELRNMEPESSYE
jgi:hypothetical protein